MNVVESVVQNVRSASKSPAVQTLVVLAIMLMVSDAAYAGGGGAEFDDVWATIREWTEGTLGRIIAGAMILVGIIGGIARQSLMAFAMGVAGGMGLYNTPTILETIMSATLENAAAVTPAVIQLSNGLGG
jgi:conjugal transfer pilus assembly protein TraA